MCAGVGGWVGGRKMGGCREERRDGRQMRECNGRACCMRAGQQPRPRCTAANRDAPHRPPELAGEGAALALPAVLGGHREVLAQRGLGAGQQMGGSGEGRRGLLKAHLAGIPYNAMRHQPAFAANMLPSAGICGKQRRAAQCTCTVGIWTAAGATTTSAAGGAGRARGRRARRTGGGMTKRLSVQAPCRYQSERCMPELLLLQLLLAVPWTMG